MLNHDPGGTSNITLLIPTMNRSDFLLRLLAYYYETGFPGHILIGDSSNAEHIQRAKRAIEEYQDQLDVTYREFPGLTDAQCMRELVQLVSTPYAAFIADDDFLVPSALKECTDYLDRHADYSAAHGAGAVFTLRESGAHGQIVSSGYYKQAQIDEETASQRLLHHLGNYASTMFSVHRTESWRIMYQTTPQVTNWSFAGEILPCSLSVVPGKVKELGCLYLVRQVHDQRYLHPDVYDWITSKDWASSCQAFSDCLAEALVKQDAISLDEANAVVKQSFWSYLAHGLSYKWASHYQQNGSSRHPQFKTAARRVPGMRWVWHMSRSFLPGDANKMALPALLSPTSPYHRDFMPIYRAVTAPQPQRMDGAVTDPKIKN